MSNTAEATASISKLATEWKVVTRTNEGTVRTLFSAFKIISAGAIIEAPGEDQFDCERFRLNESYDPSEGGFMSVSDIGLNH